VISGGFGPYLGAFNVGNLFGAPEKPISIITGLFVLCGLNYSTMQDAFGLDRHAICVTFAALQALGAVLSIVGYPASAHLPGRCGDVLLVSSFCFEVVDKAPESPRLGVHSMHSPPDTPRFLESPLLHQHKDTMVAEHVGEDAVRRGAIAVVVPSFWRKKENREIKTSLRLQVKRLSRQLSSLYERSRTGRLAEETFLVQVLSPEYIGMVIWYSLNLTWCVYFFGIVGSQINNADFCSRLVYIGSVGPALLSVFVGSIIGWLDWGRATLAASLACILMLLLSAMQDLVLGYFALLAFCVQRSLTFAIFFSYIPATFGPANYGRLIGVATLISGGVGFINGPVSAASGIMPSSRAVCNSEVTCESWSSCAIPNLALAATMLPLILYGLWLSTRPSSFDQTPASTPASSARASPAGTPKPQLRPTSPGIPEFEAKFP